MRAIWDWGKQKVSIWVALAMLFAQGFITGWNNGRQDEHIDALEDVVDELNDQQWLMNDIIAAQNDLIIEVCREAGTCVGEVEP